MENENHSQKGLVKNNTVIITLIVMIAVVVTVVGASFAYFTATANATTAQSITVTAKTYGGLEFSGSALTLTDAVPGNSQTGTFTVKNTGASGSGAIKYSLKLVTTANGYSSTNAEAKDITVNISGAGMTAATYYLGGAGNVTKTFVTDKNIAADSTDEYETIVTFAETDVDQNENQGKSFAAHIEIFGISTVA